ncbi:DUF1543 domain-containing protein [Mucilaginibacter sp.]
MELKLFMLMLGCVPPGRHIEQHDIFFAIGESLTQIVPDIKTFWPEPERIHIDAWREVISVEGYKINIVAKEDPVTSAETKKLFFINLGGYQPYKFEEQHYVVLTIKDNKAQATAEAKNTLFYQQNHFAGATSHIDDKYGIDVDDLYQIEDILPASQKAKYRIEVAAADNLVEDELHLGYLKLSSLE